MAHALVPSPIGPLFLAATRHGLSSLSFPYEALPASRSDDASAAAAALIAAAQRQLDAYFEGKRRSFDLPLDVAGTPFQRRVWQAIAAIPFGTTLSYAEVAFVAGAPNAYRAAGTACGANPVAIIIPCHRVVGSDGRLHGFGGGLDAKAWLLNHEATPPVIARERSDRGNLADRAGLTSLSIGR